MKAHADRFWFPNLSFFILSFILQFNLSFADGKEPPNNLSLGLSSSKSGGEKLKTQVNTIAKTRSEKKDARKAPGTLKEQVFVSYISNPPKGWECINDPSQLPQKVRAIYVGKGAGSSSFTPSINVACELTTLPLKEYVHLAKSYHEGQGDTRCALLGKVQTAAGTAELVQIDRPTQWGEVRFLQAMLIDQGEAYVVTATCLKNDFNIYSSQILKAIQSLNIPEKILQTK